jgi:hypothetical protein
MLQFLIRQKRSNYFHDNKLRSLCLLNNWYFSWNMILSFNKHLFVIAFNYEIKLLQITNGILSVCSLTVRLNFSHKKDLLFCVERSVFILSLWMGMGIAFSFFLLSMPQKVFPMLHSKIHATVFCVFYIFATFKFVVSLNEMIVKQILSFK